MSSHLRNVGRGFLRGISTERLDPVQEALLEEQCILVDEKDNAVGHASKRACHLIDPATGTTPLHRAFSLFVFNSKNELLLQQRSDVKVTFPGLWTNTCCSHPLAVPDEEETADAVGVRRAAQRRMLNELGVGDCKAEDMTYLTRILYASPSSGGKWGEHELDYILFFRGDLQIKPNTNEVKDVAYVGRHELDGFLRSLDGKGVGITPWFSLVAKSFLPTWWANLDQLHKYTDHENIQKFT